MLSITATHEVSLVDTIVPSVFISTSAPDIYCDEDDDLDITQTPDNFVFGLNPSGNVVIIEFFENVPLKYPFRYTSLFLLYK